LGFTLVEVVVSIVIAGAVFGIASETLIRQADTYSFIANRKTTIAGVRYAMDRISHEVLRLETSDIQAISSTSISFIDDYGQNTSFSLDTDGENLAIYRGGAVMVPDVESFTIEYQDGDGNALAALDEQIANVRRISVSIVAANNISITTSIIPRTFIGYANFQ